MNGVLATTENLIGSTVMHEGVEYRIIRKEQSKYNKNVFNYTVEAING